MIFVFNIFDSSPNLKHILSRRYMNFKISTKEILHVISLEEGELAANMTEELTHLLIKYLNDPISNIVLDLSLISRIDEPAAGILLDIQEKFYDQKHSMVICGIQKGVEEFLEEHNFLEEMNTTPKESEACDIVQMEEIERELFN